MPSPLTNVGRSSALLILMACAAASPSSPVGDSDEGSAKSRDDGSGSTSDGKGNDPGSGGDPGPHTPATDAGAGSCTPGGGPFAKEAMGADIGYLAADERKGRFPGTPGDEETVSYIEGRFRCLGLEAPFPEGRYRQPFVGAGLKTANVVGAIRGSDPAVASEIVVVGAHHDHRGVKGGKIQNGANDNASGVAAVLAIAQAVRQQPQPPRRTMVFATFGYEENDDDGPCWGSEFYVHNAPPSLPASQIVYMMNLDMLGSYPSGRQLDTYGTFTGTPGRAALTRKKSAFSQLKVVLGEVPDENDSDFQAFCKVGVPYVYFATDDKACYHESCDDLDKIDFASLSSIASLARDVVVELANDKTDLKAARRTTSTCRQ
jgi:hypothetical protein